MAISSGTRLGPYEIQSPLGAGGMGEVYRARDTRLDRTVAIKVLPEHVAADDEAKRRFEREAKTISSLNHPHICTLYDVGSQDGIDFLVMEHLEGETLARRLERGALPLERALETAIEIADALDKAHRRGIVHRDLKPGNVMLTASGAKLLDFGLAKLKGVAGNVSTAATVTSPVTAKGKLLGTLHYMSPEQLEGRDVDARADVWALGAVLYEMLTGVRPFEGSSPASLIAAVLGRTPTRIGVLQPGVTHALERVVGSCLAKDPDERLQSAHDVAIQLGWIAEEQSGTSRPEGGRRTLERRWVGAAVAAVAVTGVALMLWWAAGDRQVASAPPVSFLLHPPAETEFPPVPMFLTVSPDGRMVAFVAVDDDGTRRLWVQPIDSTEARLLPGTEGADQPFWSADSRSMAFISGVPSVLKRIEVAGGPPRTIAETPGNRTLQGATWNQDGAILFSLIEGSALFSVAASGGEVTEVTTLDTAGGELGHFWPHFLPDGDHFLYLSVNTRPDRSGIFVARLGEPGATRILDVLSNVVYSEPGFLLFTRDQTLLAQPFDTRRLRTTGDPIAIAEQMGVPPGNGRYAFAASRNGVLAYRAQPGGTDFSTLTWFDRNGTNLGTLGGPNAYRAIALSPDGSKVAAQVGWTVGVDIWVADVERGVFTRLTSDPASDESPVFSPDGLRIAFASNRARGVFDVYEVAADGSTAERLVFDSEQSKRPLQWSDDGKWILLQSDGVVALSLDGSTELTAIGDGDWPTTFGQLSPDGRWIAYVSSESGRSEVYARRFGAASRQWPVSLGGGTRPHWRGDGRELFFLGSDNFLYAVPVTLGSAPAFGTPVPLFPVRLPISISGYDGVAVTRDGERFLINVAGPGASVPVTVRVHWTAALDEGGRGAPRR